MGTAKACPHCGAERRRPLEALQAEISRIREIAERQESERHAAERETIARLSREVQALRETVALLRGTTHRPAAARSQHVSQQLTQHVRTPAARSAVA